MKPRNGARRFWRKRLVLIRLQSLGRIAPRLDFHTKSYTTLDESEVKETRPLLSLDAKLPSQPRQNCLGIQ